MFDSFHIELDGRDLEIQTKRFDCILETYRQGDWIAGATFGIAVYFDVLHLDADGRLVYSPDGVRVRTLTLFVVIAHGVFVTYQLCDGELTSEAIAQKLRQLREEWRNSSRLHSVLVESLQTKQEQIRLLQARLNRAAAVIDSARRLRSGDPLNGIFDRFREETQRLIKGDEPLDVVAWVLANDEAATGSFRDNAGSDPLAEYRL
ncbi:hypothetical protein GO003_020415 [Methylicorpusculum oleiharenae]|uniref:hypothetical protein n=1 Tax=Methylicorpusculum oleiharenae TaxID=1338687 RepID=UPI0013576668|nr:hypothetical protein [Methylicorpusculum oleiharenae]MCD2452753.1 hypothetical protein [Methylicorpusculum oleiharenae]